MQCVRFIYGYMAFAGFSIFFFPSGVIALQLIEKLQLRLDAFSFVFFLYNFAVGLTLPQLTSHAYLVKSQLFSSRCGASCRHRSGGRISRLFATMAGGGSGQCLLLAGTGAPEAGIFGDCGSGDSIYVHIRAGVDHLDNAHSHGCV